MPAFNYKAQGPAGTVVGEMEAPDRKAVVQRLQRQGLRPLSIEATSAKDSPGARPARRPARVAAPAPVAPVTRATPGKVPGGSPQVLRLSFLRRFVELVGSGLPLGDAVRLLATRLREPGPAALADDIWKALSEGRSLAGALSTRPQVFPESIINLVEAGEAAGNLVPVLQRLVAHEEAMLELRRKVTASLAYPVILVLMAIGVIILFLFVILPRFRAVIDQLGGELSLVTRLLIGGSELLVKVGPFAVVGGIVGVMALRAWRATPAGRFRSDALLLRLPIAGGIALRNELVRFGALLGTLLESGVNTTEALRLAERTVGNRDLRQRVGIARQQIQEGASIAGAFREQDILPELGSDILAIGENTGSVTGSLRELVTTYRRELESRLNLLTQVLATLALGSAFALVAMIAFAIVGSVLGVSQSLKSG